ncbi:MAG: DUF6175 family protein [Bacteroidota bacterium]
MKKIKIIPILLIVFMTSFGKAQKVNHDDVILPSVMIIPRVNEGQDIRKMVDLSPDVRVGMAAVNDAFTNYGFDTKDFESAFKKLMREMEVNPCDQCGMVELLFNSAAADVLVEVDFQYVPSAAGNKVRLIVEANHYSTALSVASEICESNMMYVEDRGALAQAALKKTKFRDAAGTRFSCADEFMKELIRFQKKLCIKGAVADLQFKIGSDSEYTMDSRVEYADDERLKYVLEDWLEENAFKGGYKIANQTDYQMMVEEYRYPCTMRDSKIERQLDRFFDDLEMEVSFKRDRGALYVTIE